MSEYEIGRDFQELRSRVERLEAFLGHDRMVVERRGVGVATISPRIRAATDTKPIHWKLKKGEQLPPFVYSRLSLPLMAQLDNAESTTWAWTPEPFIWTVNWDGGGSDEFFRLQNQSFTKTRWTTPNTGQVNAVAQFSATLVASGKGQDHPNNPNTAFIRVSMELRNSQGGPLWALEDGTIFRVTCQDNRQFACGSRFDAGLYDLVAGATGSMDAVGGYRIARCEG